MDLPFTVPRLTREGAPVAVVVLFWFGLADLLPDAAGAGLRYAGLGMALLYVVVRGVTLSRALDVPAQPTEPFDVIEENGRVALAAAAWFVASALAGAEQLSGELPGLGLLGVAFAAGGAGVVLVYAVAAGAARLRGQRPGRGPGDVDAAPADD